MAMGGVAHDLRGLLTVIKGYAELLQEESERAANPSGEVFCNKILRSCALMKDLIDNCLDLSRIEAGGLAIRPTQVDLVKFVEEAVAGPAIQARAKGITLVVDVARPLPRIDTDLNFLERIFGNIVGNAIKFSPPRATVQVLARPVGAWVEIEVSDEGPGLMTTDVPELFEAYRSGEARPTGGERSTGLGLAIVKELVGALGGSISVRGKPGQGATFSIILPAQ